MSLRAKIAIAMVAIAVLVTLLVTVLATRVTTRSLTNAIDLRLERVAQAPNLVKRLENLQVSGSGGGALRGLSFALNDNNIVQVQSGTKDVEVLWGNDPIMIPASKLAWAQANLGEPFSFSVAGTAYRAIVQAGSAGSTILIGQDMVSVEGTRTRVIRVMTWAGFIAAASAGLIGWFAASSITGPLRRLTAAADQVSATGDLDVQIPKSGTDEAGRLAGAIDGMLGSLRQSQGTQRRLVQDAGHELRTPIASVLSNAEVMRRHSDIDVATRERICDDIISESQELARLVDNLVDLTRIADDTEPCELFSAQDVVLTAVRRLPSEHAQRFTVTGDAPVFARPRQVGLALMNILTNAVKFDNGVGPIDISVVAQGDKASIRVRDHGPGMGEADLVQAFERFHRAPAAQAVPGSGLGLAIVADICRINRGTVSLANVVGGGLEVVLRFPSFADQTT